MPNPVGCAKAVTTDAGQVIVLDTVATEPSACQFFVSVPDPTAQWALLGLTPEAIAGAFGVGFGAVQGFFLLGLVIKAGHDAVKRM